MLCGTCGIDFTGSLKLVFLGGSARADDKAGRVCVVHVKTKLNKGNGLVDLAKAL